MSYYTGSKSYARIPDVLELPKLIEVQLKSFQWFLDEGLGELFAELQQESRATFS